MSVTTTVFVLYLLLLAGLALWSRRDSRSMKGYYIAGKSLPPWLVAGEVIGISLAWWLMSRRLKRLADRSDAITVPDVLAARFGDHRHTLRRLSVLIILVMVGAYVAAQMVATGKAFDGFTDLDYRGGVVLGAAIIIAYTLVGGYKAVAWTDLVQGVLMLLGLILLPLAAIHASGGWTAMLSTLSLDDPGLLSPWGPEGRSTAALVGICSFLAIGLPFMGVPQLMVRFMSARSEKSLVPAMAISITVILLFDLGAVLTGMAGRALMPGLEDPESILPLLSTSVLSPVLGGVMMVVVLAAIMSTVDSLLILASSAVVRDYWQQIRGTSLSDQALAWRGKIVTLIIGLIGIGFALHQTPLVFWFVLFAWSGLGAAFGPVLLCALWYPKTTLEGALAGMLGGFLTTVAWLLWLKPLFFDLLEVIPGFGVGLLLTIACSRPAAPSGDDRPKSFEAVSGRNTEARQPPS
jgi:sodium/proline symporter